MSRHQPSGRWQLGLALALITTACWATLPIALKLTLKSLDPITLTWARLVFAAVVTLTWLGMRGELGVLRGLGSVQYKLLAIASVGLVGNYVFYLFGVDATTPANAQLLIQAAPLLMALGAMAVFHERYAAWQWLGLVAVVGGLALFAHDQWRHQLHPSTYIAGSAWVLLAAIVWAGYALAQKQLLMRMSVAAILSIIFVVGALVLTPFAHPRALLTLAPTDALLLLYCSINTLVAYGAFAAALAHWQASRVSLVLALTPVLTLLCGYAIAALAPGAVAPERVALIGWCGAAMVVAGSALASLGGTQPRASATPLAAPSVS